MEFDAETNCNLCNNKNYTKLYSKEYKGDVFFLVECNNCGLKYINPQPTDESLKYFYDFVLNSEEWLSQFPSSLNAHYYELRTESGLAGYRTYLEHVERIIKGGNLLDVGCGDGPLFRLADHSKWKMYGLDVSAKAYEYHKKNPLVHFHYGTIESAPYEDSFFDAVFSFDAIEHVKDPMSFLKSIAGVTKTNGILCLNTVNINSKIAKQEKDKWVQFTPPGHLYYFSPKTIRMYLERSGFKVLKFDMRIPLFAPMDYGTLVKYNNCKMPNRQSVETSIRIKDFVIKILRPLKPMLIPTYDFLCQIKGRIIGKHDITVYARKA